MAEQKPVCCLKAATRTSPKMHLQPVLAPTSECRVNELSLDSAASADLAENWLFKIVCAVLMEGEEGSQ